MSKIYIEQLLEKLEGKEYNIYMDQAGLPTIGIGHLLTKDELMSGKIEIDGTPCKYQYGLSDQLIYDLLRQDIHKYESVVIVMVTTPINHNQKVALTSFCYNVGMGAFNRSTLLKVLNQGNYEAVPDQLRRWNISGGRVVNGLKWRREKEIEVWNTPV